MMELFALTGGVAIAFVLYRISRSIWFRHKTLAVIVNELQYNPAVPGFQAPAFLHAVALAKANGGNEYDAAITFMLSQLGAMTVTGESRADNEARQFKKSKYALLEPLLPKSRFGEESLKAHLKL